MPIVSHDVLRKFVYDIYRGAGGTEEDARIVSDHVVDSKPRRTRLTRCHQRP